METLKENILWLIMADHGFCFQREDFGGIVRNEAMMAEHSSFRRTKSILFQSTLSFATTQLISEKVPKVHNKLILAYKIEKSTFELQYDSIHFHLDKFHDLIFYM